MPTQLLQRVQPYLAESLTALLASLCVGLLGYSLWQWHADWSMTQQALHLPPTQLTVPNSNKINMIATAHLFGQSLTQNVPVTQLQYHVTGIVSTVEDDQSARAYITTENQPAKIYRVGETLSLGTKIHAILPDAVILENNGQLEKLPLPREKLTFKPQLKDKGE